MPLTKNDPILPSFADSSVEGVWGFLFWVFGFLVVLGVWWWVSSPGAGWGGFGWGGVLGFVFGGGLFCWGWWGVWGVFFGFVVFGGWGFFFVGWVCLFTSVALFRSTTGGGGSILKPDSSVAIPFPVMEPASTRFFMLLFSRTVDGSERRIVEEPLKVDDPVVVHVGDGHC